MLFKACKLLLIIVAMVFLHNQKSFAQAGCNTMERHAWLLKHNPSFAENLNNLERITQENLTTLRKGSNLRVNSQVVIPVVVHVLYHDPSELISDAQIMSQIDVLNEDYSKTNADANLIPSSFSFVSSGSNLQFALAKRDPNGNPTLGITKTYTPFTSFDPDDINDYMKFSATGGHDVWDRDKYLNLWVCNLSGSVVGRSQFPGGPASTDGVFIDYEYFGRTGNLAANYQKGRVTTHEVGHWFNLHHIWGDADCGDDFIFDTPTQQRANYGCPSFPYPSCNNASDMFMNYMDYTQDDCKYMFTYGQVQRMSTALASARTSISSSNGNSATSNYCPAITNFNFGGATFTDGSGINNNYQNNTDCQWLIQPIEGGVITLTFNDFNTEAINDTVVIYDGPNTSSPVLGRFSGSTIPASLTSTSNSVLIRFVTNASVTSDGWSLSYLSSNANNTDLITCGGTASYIAPVDTVADGSGVLDYSKNLDCRYVINPPGATSITMHFIEFDTEANYDFVKIYDGSSVYSPVLGIYSGSSLPPDITSSGGAVTVQFITDDAINGHGWSFKYNIINTAAGTCSDTVIFSQPSASFEDGSGTSNYSDNLDCKFLIQPAGATTVTLHFNSFNVEAVYDSVVVYDGPTTSYPVLGKFDNNHLPTDITSTTGVMLITFNSDVNNNFAGWAATYTSTGSGGSPCAGNTIYTAASGSLSDGSTVGNYTNNTDCSFLISPQGAATVTLHFNSFATEYGFDQVKIYNGPTEASSLLGIFSGSNLPPDITSTNGAMLLKFTTDALTTADGWTANYTSTAGAVNSGSCSGLLTFISPSGKISDGSGNDNYNNNADCMFLIQPANATSVTLEFLTFDTETDFDFVKIYDGTTTGAPLLGTFTGTGLPPVITSSGGAILLHFTSDNITTASGWYATYRSTTGTGGGQCTGTTTYSGPSGTISDGSGNADYSNNLNCQFLIQPQNVSNVSLNFTSFETESTNDYVKIYDGPTTASPLLGTYSGLNLPPSITSTGQSLLIVFTTDYVTVRKGWTANYSSTVSTNASLCSGLTTYNGISGTLTDGSGSYNYANNMSCRFLIQPSGAGAVLLHFNSFETETGKDFVKVYNGISTSSPLIGAFSGSTIPSDLLANSGVMLLEFISDISNTRNGWEATYTTTLATSVEEAYPVAETRLYPNPAEKELVLTGNIIQYQNVKVSNSLGEQIFQSNKIADSDNYKIDISSWPAGIYYVTLEKEVGNPKVLKFIKM